MSTAVLVGRGPRPAPLLHMLSFGSQAPVRLGHGRSLMLIVKCPYRIIEGDGDQRRWFVETAGYDYRLLDRAGGALLAYHWHPVGGSPISYPHLHLDFDLGGRTGGVDLTKAHLPTDQVTLVDVLRLAITDLGVEPLRPDCRAILDRADAARHA